MRSLRNPSVAFSSLRVQMAKWLRQAADRLAPPAPGEAVAATIDTIFRDVAAYVIQEKRRLVGRMDEQRAATRTAEHESAAARQFETRAADAERAGDDGLARELRALALAAETTAERERQRAKVLEARIDPQRNEFIRVARAVDRMQLARQAITGDWLRIGRGHGYSVSVLETLAEIWEGLVTGVDAPTDHTPEDLDS